MRIKIRFFLYDSSVATFLKIVSEIAKSLLKFFSASFLKAFSVAFLIMRFQNKGHFGVGQSATGLF